MTIATAAAAAGFSVRHFRRLIEDDHIPVMRTGRRNFILSKDFEKWEAKKGKKL